MKTTALQRVINCLKAENRTMEPSFRAYWKQTAETLAVKNNIDIVVVLLCNVYVKIFFNLHPCSGVND